MRTTIEMVAEFQEAFGHAGLPERGIPDDRTCLLRLHLLQEELGELVHGLCKRDLVEVLDALTDIQYVLDGAALACGITRPLAGGYRNMAAQPRMPSRPKEMVADLQSRLATLALALAASAPSGVEDALDALQAVLDRAYNECGMMCVKHPAFVEVHRSNMTKLGDDGRPVTDGAGRVVKGPNYQRPDLAQLIGELAA